MKHILIVIAGYALVVGLLVCPAQVARAAGGQAPFTGPELLASAEDMLQTSGTVHMTVVARFVVPGTSIETEHVSADFSYRDHWQHVFSQMSLAIQFPGGRQLITDQSEMIGIGNTAAIRGVEEHGRTIPWTCLPNTTLDYNPTTFMRDMTQVRNLGPETVGGIPVWHLRLTPSQSNSVGTHGSLRLDLEIAQSDNRIVRLTQHGVSAAATNPQTMTVSATLSQYGQPMSAALPPACRTAKS